MTRPQFTADHGIYRLDWGAPEYVRIEFDLLRQERSGDLTGEVTVSHTSPSLSGALHQARVNLASTVARETLARHLAGRTSGLGLDWSVLVDTACVTVLRAYRIGDPPVLLRDVARPDGAAFLDRHGLMLARHPVIWFGDGGDLKSYLALAAAASISGCPVLPGFEADPPRHVLYADFEFSGEDHRDRLERLCGSDMPDILYVRCERPMVAEADRLRRIAREYGRDYLVSDSVAFATDGPPEAAEAASAYYRALRQIGLPSLNVAHTTKAEGADQKPFGSAFWANGARATWYVKRSGETAGDRVTVALFNRKPPSVGRARPAVGFEFSFTEGTTTITEVGADSAADLADKLPVRDRIRRALSLGALTYAELAEQTGVTQPAIRQAIHRDNGRTFLQVIGADGVTRWGLAHAAA
jgi:hypothetical protein